MSADDAPSARRSAGETAYLSPRGVTPGQRLAAPIELTPQALRHTHCSKKRTGEYSTAKDMTEDHGMPRTGRIKPGWGAD